MVALFSTFTSSWWFRFLSFVLFLFFFGKLRQRVCTAVASSVFTFKNWMILHPFFSQKFLLFHAFDGVLVDPFFIFGAALHFCCFHSFCVVFAVFGFCSFFSRATKVFVPRCAPHFDLHAISRFQSYLRAAHRVRVQSEELCVLNCDVSVLEW